MLHARERLLWIIPLTVVLVLLLLYVHLRDPMKVFLVAICLPFSLVGGFWLTWALGYNLSVADRKSVVSGKRVSVRVVLGGRRIIKKKIQTPLTRTAY